MKTLCLSLGLLLVTLCCCSAATPKGLRVSTAPAICCFNFKTSATPMKFVSRIIQTHSSCLHKAFIVHTVKGRQICYRQNFQWAQDLYQNYNTEGSG